MSGTDLFLFVERAYNNAAFSVDYERAIDAKNIDREITKEVMEIITSFLSWKEGLFTFKKVQSSKAGASIEFEDCDGVKFEYRLSIMIKWGLVMIPVSESHLSALFATSAW